MLQADGSGTPQRPWSWKLALQLMGRAAATFAENRGNQLAGAISYFTLFALFPATLLLVSSFSFFLRDQAVQDRVLNALIDYLPITGSTIAESLQQVVDLGATATIVSFFGALWTAGALSAAIRGALNQVFEVETSRPMLRAKLVDFVLLPILAVPLIGGIVLTTILQLFRLELQERWGLLDGRWAWLWGVGSFVIPLALSFVAFAALYRLAPNQHQPFRFLWPAALFAAIAFEGLKSGFGFYLDHFANYSVYGSVGSVIVLLFWIYLTANILIFGAAIASQLPHVLYEDDGPGDEDGGGWLRSVWGFARGLVLVQDEPTRPRAHRESSAPHAEGALEREGPSGDAPTGDRRRR